MEKYDPKKIEKKWQKRWAENGIYKDYSRDKKFYALDMFPYPSGAGLHVGHPKGYIATDVVARFKMLKGYSVLHPMGWDAFGLPAENYALKNKIHPEAAVKENIKTFKKQLELFGFTYDWDREINTTDPGYYKWTQWIFLKMFEKGLAYESNEPINWCPSCKTGLANEDLEDGLCERCGSQVVQKKMRQWVLKMTAYADRLLEDLDQEKLDWEESIIEQQKNWIGRSEGAEFELRITNYELGIRVYTTRLDTVFGMTYAVVAPENPVIEKLKDKIENYKEVEKYIVRAQNKTDLERTDLQKEKTGVELKGVKVINPFNSEELSLFVADYVLGHYGTGAVMAVPAHDERDFEFAKKYNLPVRQVVAPYSLDENNPPREGKENTTRKVVHIILENKKGEVLTLNLKGEEWGENKPKTFIIGGIEDGESLEQTALREIAEETGYVDVEVVRVHPIEFHAEFFAAHKKVNRYVKTTGVVCKLLSEKKEAISEEEKKLHELVWVKRDQLSGSVTIPDDIFLAKAFVGNIDAYTDSGVLINSDKYSGLTSEKAREKMTEWLEKKKIGGKKVNYKMRDWVFSRQRYWGEPIPIIHCEKCARLRQGYDGQGTWPVPEKDLPVLLPKVKKYEPTGTGESPLANIKEWVNVKCPKCGGPGKRETNTMPQWAGSSWYYLRYIDPKNEKELVGKKEEKKWMPVDLYVGGAEHATRHLLYARFWHKFLYDIGTVSTREPFKKLVHVGLIQGEDGRKMSKRWGNVINPDAVISKYGADSIRLYEMFMGPFTQNIAWSTKGVVGMKRFLDRIFEHIKRQENNREWFDAWCDIEKWKNDKTKGDTSKNIKILLNKTIKKVTDDIENFRFNTAISQLTIFLNELYKTEPSNQFPDLVEWESSSTTFIRADDYEKFIKILSPFTPHIAEEIWQEKLGHKTSIFLEKWPKYDPKLIKDEIVMLVIQVNGKVRDQMEAAAGVNEKEAKELALGRDKIVKYIEGKNIRKIIFVPDRLINFVI
jgi:leucyl-tRNA synthetase